MEVVLLRRAEVLCCLGLLGGVFYVVVIRRRFWLGFIVTWMLLTAASGFSVAAYQEEAFAKGLDLDGGGPDSTQVGLTLF